MEILDGVCFMNSKPRLTGLGIAVGAALGAVAGVMAGHIAIWLGVGIAIGMAIGATLRRKETECQECAAVHRKHRRAGASEVR